MTETPIVRRRDAFRRVADGLAQLITDVENARDFVEQFGIDPSQVGSDSSRAVFRDAFTLLAQKEPEVAGRVLDTVEQVAETEQWDSTYWRSELNGARDSLTDGLTGFQAQPTGDPPEPPDAATGVQNPERSPAGTVLQNISEQNRQVPKGPVREGFGAPGAIAQIAPQEESPTGTAHRAPITSIGPLRHALREIEGYIAGVLDELLDQEAAENQHTDPVAFVYELGEEVEDLSRRLTNEDQDELGDLEIKVTQLDVIAWRAIRHKESEARQEQPYTTIEEIAKTVARAHAEAHRQLPLRYREMLTITQLLLIKAATSRGLGMYESTKESSYVAHKAVERHYHRNPGSHH